MAVQQFDLIIRNGTVVDGTGGASYRADIGILDGIIASIGQLPVRGKEEIDATDLIVTPGFIDVHTHYDGQVTWDQSMAPSSSHGVTTVVMGNCGVGFAPARRADQAMVVKLMEGVEDIPEVVMTTGLQWNWETFEEYLDAIDRRESDVDFAAQIPHSPLRVFVMGQRGADLEPPTDADLTEMRRLVKQGIEAGAVGVSTSRAFVHRFRDGRPAPSVGSEERELMALADGLADAGAGVFQIIPRLDAEAEDELKLMNRLIERSGRPLSFSLMHSPAMPDNWTGYVAGLDEAARTRKPLRGQFHPKPIGVLFGLDLSYHPFALNPSFRQIADLPLEQKVARMRDPELRARILAEEPDDPNPFFRQIVGQVAGLFRLGDPPNYHPAPDQSLGAEAERLGRGLRELAYDALLEKDGRAVLYVPSSPDVRAVLDRSAAFMDHPQGVVALGDGGAHYGMICDATYPTYLLTHWLGEDGMELPAAVQALTARPAALAGFRDRGLIRAGMKADINIIDLDRLTLGAPIVVRDLPAGGRRIVQPVAGYAATILSGVVTYRDGKSTGARPGRLVRRGRPIGVRQRPAID